MNSAELSSLSKDQKLQLLESLMELDNRLKYNKAKGYFTDTGPNARSYYTKQIAFMNAGKTNLERCFIGSNRSGKSETCAFETYLHATGLYDQHSWYDGIKFSPAEDITIWIGGVSHSDVRDIQQHKLLGPMRNVGTGLLPKDLILDMKAKPGVPNAVTEVSIQRAGGGIATIYFKSYEQGRESFQGTAVHFIGLDEECPQDVYEECLTRCATVNGRIALYFTPLHGLSSTVLHFLVNGRIPKDHKVPGRSAYVENIQWEDVPLQIFPQAMRDQMEASFLPHQKEARTKGLPTVGDGRIYTTLEKTFVVQPFKVPFHWAKMYALDIGYECTAAVWLTYDKDSDTLYVYDEYYSEKELPTTHVAAILGKGKWIPGVIDPSALQTNKHDGKTSFMLYREMGLDVRLADNRVQAGIMEVQNRLATGRLKVFSSCTNVLEEYRLYRYATNKTTGETIVARKQSDHAMDAMRYGVMAKSVAEVYIDPDDEDRFKRPGRRTGTPNPTTGY